MSHEIDNQFAALLFVYEKFSQLGNILVIFMKMLGADCFGNVETRR